MNMKKTILILLILVLVLSSYFYYNFMDVTKSELLSYQMMLEKTQLFIDAEAVEGEAVIHKTDAHTFVLVDVVEHIMPQNYRIAPSGKRILFSKDGLDLSGVPEPFKSQLISGDFEINLPVVDVGGAKYIEVGHLSELMGYKLIEGENHVVLFTGSQQSLYGFVDDKSALRVKGAPLSAVIRTLFGKERVLVVDETGDYMKIVTSVGEMGFVDKKDVRDLYHMPKPPFSFVKQEAKTKYGRVQMTWDHVSSYEELIDQTPTEKIEGLDIIIPTVFRLTVDGWVLNNMDKRYIQEAKALGYQVHALFDNQFDPELTHATLKDEVLVRRIIDQLTFYAIYYGLDGINIDFENVDIADQDAITDFITKLNEKTQELGIVLSVDVTRPGGSDNWSKFINRADVARVADYVILMAYDEHWATSEVSGSVASIPWVEESIKLTLKEVPKHKLILGVPTYMRVWTETKVEDSIKVSSSALSMKNMADFLLKYDVYKSYDEKIGQTYYEMQGDGEDTVLRIWAEDERSVTNRLKLISKYDLAGVASWRHGFEVSAFWDWVNEKLDN
ncbi:MULTISPECIES: glycosyl hydrolase family 18 protein [unclassified Fusibacter]|uniref:glycosyl hydrolase family 18 protein n=1 Tax=unclassified Fusibacter TaxID=2624464 RepID=UPI001011C5EE|nr:MULTISPECIES: glycosyl hydrolase family 18 protein [unclassified Fusibacter]MCK8061027.1 glycosyl hydrolase family 18 protein [Fusibacter sp. A2]NPE20519.1 hypothetical protein [Fusibacter sp. A1]RXV63717.1 hypothetical protein DWB64_01705 [Fusibacter sp. A1]